MKKLKMLAIIIIINFIFSLFFSMMSNKVFAIEQKFSSDINNIDDKKYPGIKALIQKMQNEHKSWNFKVLYTGLRWEDVINAESNHGVNLVQANQSHVAVA